MSAHTRWLAALAGLTALRLVVAAAAPLAPDEAYYWVWSRALAPGYLDHPPMVALWIRAGTALAGDTAFGIRLFGPIATAIGSLLLADAGSRLFPGRNAGLWAAILMNATLLVGAGAATMTPDAPLLFFWVAALWVMARIVSGGHGAWFLAVGLAAGLALDSKYTAVFLGAGIALWLLFTAPGRRWMRTPWPWAGLALAAAAFAPVLAWNAAHDWASFAKQGSRAGVFSIGRAAKYLPELIGGQFGLATPIIFLLCCAGVASMLRRRDPAARLIAALTLPATLVFMEHAFGDRVQANWPAILYPTATLAAGALAGQRWQRLRIPGASLGFAVSAIVYIQATLAPLTLSPHTDPTMRQLAGWPVLAMQVETAAADAAFVASDDYGAAAQLARLLPATLPVLGDDARWRFFDLPRPDVAGRQGLLLRSMRRGEDFDSAAFSNVERIGTVARVRGGVTAEAFRVYRVTAAPGDRLATLPRPEP